MAKDYQKTRSGLVAINKDQNIVSAGDLSRTKQDVSQWSGKGGLLHNKGWAVCDGSTYDPLVFPELDDALGNPVSKVVPNGPYRTRELTYPEVDITSSLSGFNIAQGHSHLIFYTDSVGNWRLRFNIRASHSTTNTGLVMTLTGVVFSSSIVGSQGIGFSGASDTQAGRAFALSGASDITIQSATSISSMSVFGDIALESKPTITNFDSYLENYPIIATANNVLSNSLGLPEPTTNVAGLWSTDQVNGVLENECVNGSFDFNQRSAASYTTYGEYTLDRFEMFGQTVSTTVTQQDFDAGQTDVYGNPEHYLRAVFSGGSAALDHALISTKLENLKKYSGETVTIGVDLKADTAKDISFEFRSNYGTGGSPTGGLNGMVVRKISITDTWNRYYLTVQIPSFFGDSFGTDNNSYLMLLMWLSAGSNYNTETDTLGHQDGTIEFANLDIKRTKLQTPFTRAGGTYAGELALCERYYEVIESTGRLVSTGVADGNWFARGEFKTKKRGPISLSVYYDSISGSIGQVRQYGGASLAVTVSPNSIDSYQIVNDSGATVSPYGITYGLRIDAEL